MIGIIVSVVAASVAGVFIIRNLYPKPLPGIPYNKASAARIAGDVPDLIPIIKERNEFSHALFAVTTQKLGTPIAQLLFPMGQQPLIVIEDPREIEDITTRRDKEFDKAPMAMDIMRPMFPGATASQFTTPELKAQKRLWADVMNPEFLRRAAAPWIHKSGTELVELWRLKATTIHKDEAFVVLDDLKNAALDVVWVAVIGEEPGETQHELRKLQKTLSGDATGDDNHASHGSFIRSEVEYISKTIARNSATLSPKWAQIITTYTPRYRQFRKVVNQEISRAMRKAVDRFYRLEQGALEDGETDTCMMDLVLRRQILDAKRAGREPSDPLEDQSLHDEMFAMLVAGHDTTANTLAWFAKFMSANPTSQAKLRNNLQETFSSTMPSIEEILETNIPYLDGTCEETFRLSGTAKANLRSATVDTQILGCPIPKGGQLFMNYHINQTPAPWDESKRSATSKAAVAKHKDGLSGRAGQDLASFEPERWLQKDALGKETFNAYAIPALAFGGGFRGCAGKRLARMELRIMVVLLILHFEFLPLSGELTSMLGIETFFREPAKPYAKLRVLEH